MLYGAALLLLAAAAILWSGNLANAAPPCLEAPGDMIAWWRGEGNAYDSRGLNDGWVIGGVPFANGMMGKAFAFSGEGDEYVRLPSDVFPLPNEGTAIVPFTLELWFKTAHSGVIIGQQDVTPFAIPEDGYVPALYVGTNGLLYAHMFWGLNDVLATSQPVNDDKFHHVAVTYDGLQEVLYLDGQSVAWTECSQVGYSTHYQYQIGTAYTGGWPGTPGLWFPFRGLVDEVALYSRSLTAEQVRAIYQAGDAGKCGGPILRQRYSFNEPASTFHVRDSIRNAHGALMFASGASPYTNGVADGSGFTGQGELALGGNSGFVLLPPQMASWLLKATFECWVTWNGPAESSWQRIFDFGFNDRGTNAAGSGTNYLMLSPSIGGIEVLGFQETTVDPFSQQNDPRSLILSSPKQMPMGRQVYVALIYDPEGQSALYVDGIRVAAISGKELNPLKVFADNNCYLGRSQWQRDPHFNGKFNEFRAWEGILSQDEITAHYAAGPDQDFTFEVTPRLSVIAGSTGLRILWPANATGYSLEWSPDVLAGYWLPVTNQPALQQEQLSVLLDFQQSSAFYRLRK